MNKKSNSIVIILLFLSTLLFYQANAQRDREQNIGAPKEVKNINTIMKGEVRSKASGQTVPDADITVKESTTQKVINQTKANGSGAYEVTFPKGMDIEVKAQAPEFFYDAFKIKVNTDDTSAAVVHNFLLPSELQLRLNFPTNKYDKPYPYVLDDDGLETSQTWESAVTSVAEDILKYVAYIQRLIIVGHTDEDGTNQSNMTLGQNRAEFLKDELQKRGVPETMIEARSSGEEELLSKRPNEDSKMWKKRCRRVVLTKEMKK